MIKRRLIWQNSRKYHPLNWLTEAEISAACAEAGITERKFECLDYMTSDLLAKFADQMYEMRKAKGVTGKSSRHGFQPHLLRRHDVQKQTR